MRTICLHKRRLESWWPRAGWLGLAFLALLAAGCAGAGESSTTISASTPREGDGEVSSFTMSVEGVDRGGSIPVEYTCDGSGVVPSVVVSSVPEGTAELALIVDDPDAPRQDPFVHWVVYGIDPSVREITDARPDLMRGINDAGSDRWSGPCPPRGDDPHAYHWRLFALGKKLDLPAGLDGRELERAIASEVIADTEFVAFYQRGG